MTDHDGSRRPTFRRGTADDIEPCHTLLWETVTDLGRRQATPLEGTAEDWWESGGPFQRFLAENPDEARAIIGSSVHDRIADQRIYHHVDDIVGQMFDWDVDFDQ